MVSEELPGGSAGAASRLTGLTGVGPRLQFMWRLHRYPGRFAHLVVFIMWAVMGRRKQADYKLLCILLPPMYIKSMSEN